MLSTYHREGRGVTKDPTEAARWLRMAAEQGHAVAQYGLGMLHVQGDGVSADAYEAVRWLQRAAQQGHDRAAEIIDGMFDLGIDEDKLLDLLDATPEAPADARVNQLWAAAEAGDAEAQYQLTLAYAERRGDGDTERALTWLNRAANQGHPAAMADLGTLYMDTDSALALRWLRAAAEEGHGGAQVNLGSMYFEGEGLPKDYAEGVRLFRMAAEQGNAMPQYNLGQAYRRGHGVPKDTKEAVRWFRLAEAQGDTAAGFAALAAQLE